MAIKRVVITGLGATTPLGNSIDSFWNGLVQGISGAGPISLFDTTHYKTKFACEVKNFDPKDYMDSKEARKMARFSHLAMAATNEAVADGSINFETLDTSRIGVILGTGIGGLESLEKEMVSYAKGEMIPQFSPFFIPRMISDISAGHISIKYNLRGPNFVASSACASSTHALIDAMNYIRLGYADMIISGGSEAPITESGVGGFSSMKALSTRNDAPEKASRPYDANRDGFVVAEGAGILIVEELEHALRRGAKIYGELIGMGVSGDAYHLTAPHPDGAGVKLAMNSCLKDAGLNPEDVDCINTHGTSTPLGDLVELNAIQHVFNAHIKNMNVTSTKSMTGHLLGASGAVEVISSLLSIRDNVVPPTINLDDIDQGVHPDFNLTPNKPEYREVKTVMSNNFGFGGHNASVLLREFKE